MKKYKKIKIEFEEKVLDKKRKPVYGTRKLSVGLVSCMLGFMMFLPTSKASEEDPITTIQQVEEKNNEVLDKKDDLVQEEKEEVTSLNYQTDTKVDSEENLSDQNLDGQNKEENTIKDEETNSNLENKDEELLTADEIQAIRIRANSLEKSYFFNDNMIEELKAELRKAKADPSINYDQAKARLIDEAILKNTPENEAPGEVRAESVRKPTIGAVSIGDTVVSGKGLVGRKQRERVGAVCKIHVTIKDSNDVVVETAEFSIGPKERGSEWSVTLKNPIQKGYKVIAQQEFNGSFSEEVTSEVKAQISDSYKGKLTMPEIRVKSEDLHVIEADAVEDIINAFRVANKEKLADGKTLEENLATKNPIDVAGDGKSITVNFSDGSYLTLDVSKEVIVEKITEISTAPQINDLKVVDNKITGKVDLSKVQNLERLRVKIIELGSNGSDNFCTDKGCTIDKNSQELGEAKVDPNTGEFSFDLDNNKLVLGKDIGVVVKEYQKKNNCSTVQPSLVQPEVYVKDPKNLKDDDKKAIDEAIRKANSINNKSKLPDGTGYLKDKAFIEFDKEGNVRIISPNDVVVTWDNGNPVYQKNPDGSYKLQTGKESNVITFPVKDFIKNIKPDSPTIDKDSDKNLVKVDPISDLKDTDIIEHTVTYTGIDGVEKKIVATHDLDTG